MKKGTVWRRVKLNLAAGLLVLLPLYLTYVILSKLFLLIDGILNRLATRALVAALRLPLRDEQVIYGLGITALFIVVFATGWLARHYLGNRLIAWFNYTLDKVPIVNRVYKTVRQIVEAIFSADKRSFQRPVLIEYPRKGLYTLAFQTRDTGGAVQDAVKEDCITVFLPSTPNPTTGYVLFVPKSRTFDVDMTSEEAFKLIISGGVVTPEKSSALEAASPAKRPNSSPSNSSSQGEQQ